MLAVLLVGWRLASGPVSIGFLTPYLQNALNELHDGKFQVEVEDTILSWAGWERTLDIRVVNVQTKSASGEVVASVPEVSIALSADALLKGTIAPRSIEVFGLNLSLTRGRDGQLSLGIQNPLVGNAESRLQKSGEVRGQATTRSESLINGLLFFMLQDADPTQAMSYLKRVSLVAGEITFDDKASGTQWYAPTADANIVRVNDGLQAELDLSVQAGSKLTEVAVLATYLPERKRVDLGVSFDDITPASFAEISPNMSLLSALDLPLSGTLTLSIEQNGQVEGVGFDLTGKAGHVSFPVGLAADLGVLPWAQRIGVNDLSVRGRYEGSNQLLDISALSLSPAKGQNIYLPHPFNMDMDIQRLKTELIYQATAGRLDLKNLNVGLVGDTEVTVSASVLGLSTSHPKNLSLGLVPGITQGQSKDLSIDISSLAENIPLDTLKSLWPKSFGAEARAWVVDSLSHGTIDRVATQVALRPSLTPGGEMRVASLRGDLLGHGLEVNYINTMPRAKNVSGRATFTESQFDFHVESGESDGGLKILGGDIALSISPEKAGWADISLKIEGTIPAALELLDSEPLGYSKDLGIAPNSTTGHVLADLSLRVPLEGEVLVGDMEVQVAAQLQDATFVGLVLDKDLSQGNLDLVVDGEGLEVKGNAVLGEVPVKMVWNHDFRPNALFTDRYSITGYVDDVLNLDALGVQVPPILSQYMHGGTEVNVDYTVLGDGRQSLSARVDMGKINLSVPELGWVKLAGVPGTAVLEMRLNDDRVEQIPSFSVMAPDMELTGSATFLKNGSLERIDMDTMRSGLTDVAASITPMTDGAWEIVLRGESLDARLIWDEMIGIEGAEPAQPDPTTELQEQELQVHAAVDIRNLILGENQVVRDFIGTVYRDRGLWHKFDISGEVGKNSSVELMLDTAKDGLRYLSIESNNAGDALKTLGLYNNILGGAFDLKAAYTRPDKNAPLEGVAKVSNYAMIKAPAFTKLIGVMALTGIGDALKGDGLSLDVLEAPFKLQDGVLELTQARASGPSVGVTASGVVDMGKREVDLKGTVVPAYAINALLGKIPLIGKLFSGSGDGGGLFAATYTMKGQGENVDITINPLSVLAPGALQNIFKGTTPTATLPTNP